VPEPPPVGTALPDVQAGQRSAGAGGVAGRSVPDAYRPSTISKKRHPPFTSSKANLRLI